MKKFRGQNRYYRNLKKHRDFKSYTLFNFSENTCFNDWHTHYDWLGLGNNSWKKRKPHLDTLFRNFDEYIDQLPLINKPFQLFVILFDFDSSEDRICIHTQNPMQDNFPIELNLKEISNLKNKRLIAYLQDINTEFEYRYTEINNESICVIFKKGIGLEVN